MAADKVVINLKELEEKIPRNKAGDPAFEVLYHEDLPEDLHEQPNAVLTVFTQPQVVALVNRALYQMEYSRKAHRDRSQRERDLMAPLKVLLKELHPGTSWINATEEQLDDCMNEHKKRMEAQHGK